MFKSVLGLHRGRRHVEMTAHCLGDLPEGHALDGAYAPAMELVALLGLDPSKLQAVRIEGTQTLPGLTVSVPTLDAASGGLSVEKPLLELTQVPVPQFVDRFQALEPPLLHECVDRALHEIQCARDAEVPHAVHDGSAHLGP